MIHDSGTRRQFDTGAVRDAAGNKGRFDLLPFYGMQRLAQHFEGGARKYDPWNWHKGIPQWAYIDSGIRHAMKYSNGLRDEDHAAAAAWNFVCAMDQEERYRLGELPGTLFEGLIWTPEGPSNQQETK